MFFAIISKYFDNSNKIIELSNEVRYMSYFLRKRVLIRKVIIFLNIINFSLVIFLNKLSN